MKYLDSQGWTDTRATMGKINNLIKELLTQQVAGPYDKRLLVEVMDPEELKILQGTLLEHATTIGILLSK